MAQEPGDEQPSANSSPTKQIKKPTTEELIDFLDQQKQDAFYQCQKAIDRIIDQYKRNLDFAAKEIVRKDQEAIIAQAEVQRLKELWKKNKIDPEPPKTKPTKTTRSSTT